MHNRFGSSSWLPRAMYSALPSSLPLLSNPHPVGTCCPGQSSGGAGLSSRLGFGAAEVAHMTPVGVGAFLRMEAAPGIHLERLSPAGVKSIVVH